jgi:exonuclease III
MSTKKPNLNILKSLLWNANGLKQHETELLHLLLEKQIDIALITETHCKPNTKLFFPGFKFFRTDHPDKTVQAGTAIIISSKIQHQLLPNIQLPTIIINNYSDNIKPRSYQNFFSLTFLLTRPYLQDN